MTGLAKARRWTLALAAVCAICLPASGQEDCTERDKLSLIYDPDEPPPCPVPMRDLVPSRIGRPHDYTAFVLAACAGQMDAHREFVIQHYRWAEMPKDWVSGDQFMSAALARRDRPSSQDLATLRTRSAYIMRGSLRDYLVSRNSGVTHGFVMCLGEYDRATRR